MTTTEPTIADTDTTDTEVDKTAPDSTITAGQVPREEGTPEDRLIAALGHEPDVSDLPPDQAEQTLAAWREAWTLRDLEDADYAARKLQQVRARIGEIDALERTRTAQISEWAERERARHEPDIAYYTGRLETFHRFRRAEDEKHNKSIDLPCGVVLRSQAGKLSLVITDEAEAVAWLEQHLAAAVVYPAPKVDKIEAMKRVGAKAQSEKAEGTYPGVTADGEIVPGVEIVRSGVTYKIS